MNVDIVVVSLCTFLQLSSINLKDFSVKTALVVSLTTSLRNDSDNSFLVGGIKFGLRADINSRNVTISDTL